MQSQPYLLRRNIVSPRSVSTPSFLILLSNLMSVLSRSFVSVQRTRYARSRHDEGSEQRRRQERRESNLMPKVK